MEPPPLAHSAPRPGRPPQTYADHVTAVVAGARRRAEEAVAFCRDPELREHFVAAVVTAATFHDLGKLDEETQQALRDDRKLFWDHIDAGVAHLIGNLVPASAWLARGHHAPGLPAHAAHFNGGSNAWKLRGRRNDNADLQKRLDQIARTDENLASWLAIHVLVCGRLDLPLKLPPIHGLALRFMLSCLVDADHADTAAFLRGWREPASPAPRWEERLAALDAYVASLRDSGSERDAQRRAFYALCRHEFPADEALIACEGPVGIGKTTAVTAWLLRRAIASGARRLFVVAPFTNILTEAAETLRDALTLPGEDPEAVVAEHHHRADFTDASSRDLATLWNAPVVLTTAVQFFETLASNHPGRLRKLHALPGSVIFLDEAHAALPVHLWAQNWRWLQELVAGWGCSAVLASGSLARFWEMPEVVGAERLATLPVLSDDAQTCQQRALERARVVFDSLGLLETPAELMARVVATSGPRLLIMNTVQSAAVVAKLMRDAGHDVLHISTALSPRDRANVLRRVRERLRDTSDTEWTLVATSLVEAGVNLSFRTGFRERFSTASLLQIAGRVNRNSEFGGPCTVYDFQLRTTGDLVAHPGAAISAQVLGNLLAAGRFGQEELDAAALESEALRRELWSSTTLRRDSLALRAAEAAKDYPAVARLGVVIQDETVLVAVDPTLRARLEAGEVVTPRDLVMGSVRMRENKLGSHGLEEIEGRREIYVWRHDYDPDFLGYIAGVLAKRLPATEATGAE